MASQLAILNAWVQEVAQLTQPDQIRWCDGSEAERRELEQLMVERGDLLPLNPETHPDCFLHRSHPGDVARVEHLTFVCTRHPDDAGPNNNWLEPGAAHAQMDALFVSALTYPA